MRTATCLLLALLAFTAVFVSGESAAKPCDKVKDAPPLAAIEDSYPNLVTDFHASPLDYNPNSVDDKEADRTARVIIREHAAWEKDNPAPPKQLDTQELKMLGLDVEEQTLEIQKEGKKFDNLQKWVENDAQEYERQKKEAEEKKAKDAAAAQKEAAETAKLNADMEVMKQQRAAIAKVREEQDKKRAAAAKAAKEKAAALSSTPAAELTKTPAAAGATATATEDEVKRALAAATAPNALQGAPAAATPAAPAAAPATAPAAAPAAPPAAAPAPAPAAPPAAAPAPAAFISKSAASKKIRGLKNKVAGL